MMRRMIGRDMGLRISVRPSDVRPQGPTSHAHRSTAAAGASVLAVVALDRWLDGCRSWLAFNDRPTSAQQILATIATSMMTFTGLVFTLTIVVQQLASSQFSPRVLHRVLTGLRLGYGPVRTLVSIAVLAALAIVARLTPWTWRPAIADR